MAVNTNFPGHGEQPLSLPHPWLIWPRWLQGPWKSMELEERIVILEQAVHGRAQDRRRPGL